MLKKCKVVILPTEKAENCLIKYEGQKTQVLIPFKPNYLYTQRYLKENYSTSHHLYILSDEEIKEGDYSIFENNIVKILSYNRSKLDLVDVEFLNSNKITIHKDNLEYKIIATTDKSLKIDTEIFGKNRYKLFPEPSQSFIEKYIQKYNQGNPITEVMVEYDYLNTFILQEDGQAYMDKRIESETLKVNPKDNTITIKPVKDSWNREEVVQLLRNREDFFFDTYDNLEIDRSLNKWISENL